MTIDRTGGVTDEPDVDTDAYVTDDDDLTGQHNVTYNHIDTCSKCAKLKSWSHL